MGTCTCSGDIRPTNTNYGGTLKWTWADGHKFSTWRGPARYCNPYNCSNKACKSKGCAQARALFCSQHGFHCPSLGKKVCWGEKCPGGMKKCLNSAAEAPFYGNLPYCGPINTGGSSGGSDSDSKTPSGPDTRNCSQGNFMACFSELGVGFGNFFTDATRTGGQQLPLMLILGAGIILVLLLKK